MVPTYLIASMLVVLWFDISRFIIPNWLVGLMLVSYPAAVALAPAPVDWLMAVAGMLLMLVAGYFIFTMKWTGGGDIKLLTACALWVGWVNLPEFILIVALLGGVLSLGILAMRKSVPFLPKKPASLPRILRDKEPVPYGVAIAVGFLIALFNGQVPTVHF